VLSPAMRPMLPLGREVRHKQAHVHGRAPRVLFLFFNIALLCVVLLLLQQQHSNGCILYCSIWRYIYILGPVNLLLCIV
jgi:hypothetical protein